MMRRVFWFVVLLALAVVFAGCGDNDAVVELPPQSNTATWQSVAAGDANFAFGIKTDGSLWAWGNNSDGQLGIGNTTLQRVPVRVDSGRNWQSVSIGAASAPFVLALKTDGTLWGWGDNEFGQLGDGTTTSSTTPVQVGGGNTWAAVAAGYSFSVALKTDGTLWHWGKLTAIGASDSLTPVQFGAAADWVAVVAGQHILAIKTDGSLWGWGHNGNGQVGIGSTATPVTVPQQIRPGETWLAVSVNASSSHALRSDHTLWSWGFQGMGSLGQGTDGGGSGNVTSPGQIGTASDWAMVNSGSYNTMAVKTDGTLWGWGWNIASGLGDGTDEKRVSPVPIGSATDWKSVAVGSFFSLGLKTDGALWGWGENSSGQLGDDVPDVSTIPRFIGR